jgi:hypothetical protein
MKTITIEEILAKNPQVDGETLRKSMELLKKMRERGVKGRRHNIISPYVRRISKAKRSNYRLMHVRRY